MEIHKIKGFADIFYPESAIYSHIEAVGRKIFPLYMYKELRTPLVEFTELFVRGIGTTTDVVQKEMYTFEDKKERSITLRPEATAGVVRAYIESGMQGVLKAFTFGAMFRYERPQKGRMRQFHQVNCECIGSEAPTTDAEIIAMLFQFLQTLQIGEITLLLNSLGCAECRPVYKKELLEYLHTIAPHLCSTCTSRMEQNPLRVLDCKEKMCKEHTHNAPKITECLCSACTEHFSTVKKLLEVLHIPFVLEPRLVRGLDYYSRTTFEVVSNNIGAQSSIAGGGRYDSLVEQIGGKATPAIGFACGMERLVLLLQSQNKSMEKEEKVPYYIAPLCAHSHEIAQYIAYELRKVGVKVEVAPSTVTVKHSMKYAGKYAHNSILLGEDELSQNVYTIKNMETGVQNTYPLEQCVENCLRERENISPNKENTSIIE